MTNGGSNTSLQLVPAAPDWIPPAVGDVVHSSTTDESYCLFEYIGEGFFSYVYGCRDSWGNELVAKAIKPRGRPKDAVLQAALAEVEKLVQLRHPNITYIFDAFTFDETTFIVSERCDSTLRQMFTATFTGHHWIRPMARCLLQGVDFIHARGFVHRDLHLDNVMTRYIRDEVAPDAFEACTFKVGDLGLCTLANALSADSTFAEWIKPPEVLDSQFGPIDHRLDLYHLGLIFLQVLEGHEIGFSQQDILNGRPRERALALPAPFSTAIEKCLRRRVAFRSASAKEVWRDLNGRSS